MIPVRIMRIDRDHGVVGGAAAKRARARIEDAIALSDEFLIAFLSRNVAIVPDEIVPL